MLSSGCSCHDCLYKLKINGMNCRLQGLANASTSCAGWVENGFLSQRSILRSYSFEWFNMQDVKVPFKGWNWTDIGGLWIICPVRSAGFMSCLLSGGILSRTWAGLESPDTHQKIWIVSRWLQLQARNMLVGYKDIQLLPTEFTEYSLLHSIPSSGRGLAWGCTQISIPSYYSKTKKHIAQGYIWLP